jgi:hypothetical protein
MTKTAKYLDIVYLGLIGIIITISIVRVIAYNFILPVNTYVGLACWLGGVVLKIFTPKKTKYFLSAILILSTLNLITFTVETFAFGVGSHLFTWQGFYFCAVSINPIALVLMVIYFSINFSTAKTLIKKIFGSSEKEEKDAYDKSFQFYYQKFVSYNDDDFKVIIKNFDDYPLEAREAIEFIVKQKDGKI